MPYTKTKRHEGYGAQDFLQYLSDHKPGDVLMVRGSETEWIYLRVITKDEYDHPDRRTHAKR